MAVPTSTYRFHLTHAFTLHDAAGMVAHLDRLGVDWAYASPIQTVPPGATHGYHITDPDRINPELGGEEGLAALHRELATRGRRLLLDVVPNHMAASPANAWWADLLRRGPASEHARTFDVDLGTAEAPRPIVLPVLGIPLDQAIAEGAVRVEGQQLVIHDDLRLPLAEGTDPDAPIEAVLDRQHYRLHLWHEGERVLNWRRFFAVNELVALRVEDPAVFDATHRLIARLLADGVLSGIRVDHIDGLADPAAYLHRLRDLAGPDTWLLVEKILDRDERLPAGWPIAGTTGYEVGNAIAQWLLDRDGHHRLVEAFETATDLHGPVGDALPQSKLHVVHALFDAEVAAIGRLLGPVDGVPAEDAAQVIRLLAAHMEGYRPYVAPDQPIGPADDHRLDAAIRAASVTAGRAAEAVGHALTADAGRPALLRLQQLTGPAAAKGFEDRLLYRHVALSSLCEVGSDAATLDHPWAPAEAAAALVARQADAPDAGTTTSTHDTKRAEDVRAAIHVLAEVPDAFTGLLADLEAMGGPTGTDAHARWLLAQQAVALLALDRQPPAELLPRLQAYAGKALREAEVATSHADADEAYEAAVEDWLGWLLEGDALARVTALAEEIRLPGLSNALSALVLKLLAPGVPDVYRGTEVWDDSLVDPDNRRPLDRPVLDAALRRVEGITGTDPGWWLGEPFAEAVAGLRDSWHDGAVKLHVTRTGLHLRRGRPDLFARGAITAPVAHGGAAAHVAALRRDHPEHGGVIAVATRLPHGLAGPAWPVGSAWGDAVLPMDGAPGTVVDALTGRALAVADGHVALAEVLAVLPVALLTWDRP